MDDRFDPKRCPLLYRIYESYGGVEDEIEKYKGKTKQIKPYLFRKDIYESYSENQHDLLSLSSPYGRNLFSVLKNNKALLKKVSAMFREYGYNLAVDYVTDVTEIQKNVDGVIYRIPYSLIADTLQRSIFHSCAIYSNENQVITFEEPENNSFPPYVRQLALDIIESESNQFFIATHSPYLFNTIISEAKREEVAVHIVNFEDFQTKTKLLSQEEISEISNYGIDVFFNLDMFAS